MNTTDPSDRGGFPWGVVLPAGVFLSPALVWLSIHISFAIHPAGDWQAVAVFLVPLFMLPIALFLSIVAVVAGGRRSRILSSRGVMIGWLVLAVLGSAAVIVFGP